MICNETPGADAGSDSGAWENSRAESVGAIRTNFQALSSKIEPRPLVQGGGQICRLVMSATHRGF